MKKFNPLALSAPVLGLAVILLFLAGCRKETSYENPTVNLAAGSLWDASGNCLPASLGGTWYDGVTPGDTNYVDITVNVSKVGYYAIYTDLQNGVQLADSGNFTSLGETTVRLKPIGTFINYGNTNFAVGFDTTYCDFTIPVQDSTGTGLGSGGSGGGGSSGGGSTTVGANEWTFTAGGKTYSGSVTVGAITTSSKLLLITGVNASFDSVFGISMQLSSTTPTAGSSYKTSASSGANMFEYYTASTSINYIYKAFSTTGSKVITIKITGYDASTQTVTGTFDGTAADKSGNSVNITNGAFNSTLIIQ